MLIDTRFVANNAGFDCDLCVVGAGPAGISIVDRLRNSGLSIILLESGGFNLELPTQKLYRGEIHGRPYFRLDACRWRLFGGSSNRWGGWCRPLEPIDFDKREWLPHSGWPITADTLQPYISDASKLLELTSHSFEFRDWQNRLSKPLDLSGTDFENIVFQFSPETNFGEVYRDRLINDPDIKVFVYANVTDIRLEPQSNRVGTLRASTLTGRTINVRPRATALATGGIENARLLLASQRDRSAGLGNQNDLVGRFFMEHLHVPVGHLLTPPGAFHSEFYRKTQYGPARLRGVIAPRATAQNSAHLLGTSIAIEPPRYSFGTPFVGSPPALTFPPAELYKRFRKGRLARLSERARRAIEMVQALPIKMQTSRAARGASRRVSEDDRQGRNLHSLYFRAEQAPAAINRVSLSSTRDALGVQETRLDWSVTQQDTNSIQAWLKAFSRDVRARGLGQVVAPAEGWEDVIIGGPHHMGTTRMSDDPRNGVVDADCRVHSIENLYVAGSSVFATGGYTNPTFALVALALRLADTLKVRLRN